MKLTVLASVLLAGALSAVEILPGGFVSPTQGKMSTMEKNSKDYFRIREKRAVFVSPDASGTLSVYMKNEQVGHYEVTSSYALYDLDNNLIEDGRLALHQAIHVKKTGLKPGIYRFVMNSGLNSAIVRSEVGFCCAEATQAQPLEFIYHCPKVYFSVLSGHLKMMVKGERDMEHVALTIWDANGKVVLKDNTLKKEKIMVDIPIPKEQEGSAWSMIMERVPGKGFEDMSFAILEGAEPIVALKPEGLVFPIVRLAHHAVGTDKAFAGIVISQLVRYEPNLTVNFRFTPDTNCKIPPQKGTWKSGDMNPEVGFVVGNKDFVSGRLAVAVSRRGEKKPLFQNSWQLTMCEGKLFEEVVWREKGKPAAVTAEDKARGYQVFQRAEPGFVRPNTTPGAGECCSVVKAETSPGLVTAEFFAVLPLKELGKAHVAIGNLKSANGDVLRAKDIDILAARIWGQRVDWNSLTYIVAPELLEKKASVELKAGLPQQFCVKLKVPADAKPGVYKGMITLDGKKCVPYELTVDDFRLPEYDDITFGLYADGERWHENPYTDDEVRAEMEMFRDYGMNSLMVYPFTGCKITYDRGTKTWNVNMDVFRHHQKIYTQVGFKGIQVISLQAMDGWLRKALPRGYAQEEYLAGFKAVLDTLDRMAKEDHWEPYILHTVDEPHNDELGIRARDTLKFIKDNGYKTFCTCFSSPLLDKYLAPCLDYRCYSNVAFSAYSSKKETARIRKNTLDNKANFWWYGSGCYTNGGLQQDCNIYSNRHMLGVFHWRSKATGAWTWTFLRAKGDVYNDFDHNNSGEAKEACICYPMPKSNELIDTIEWEGCREGIYDYRYIRFWDELAKAAEKNTDKAELARKSREKVEAAIEKIAWTCMDFQVSNQELRDLRKLVIAEIKKLK